MSLQSKPLVGKGISSLKPRLRLGFRGRNFFADLGLGLQRYISETKILNSHYQNSMNLKFDKLIFQNNIFLTIICHSLSDKSG